MSTGITSRLRPTSFSLSSYVPFFCAWAFVLCVLLLQQPKTLFSAELLAEDGAIFFKEAYEGTLFNSLFRHFNGYWHVIPRIIAEFSSVLPLRWIPFGYFLVSKSIAAVCFAWFALPQMRELIANDMGRIGVALTLALSPYLPDSGTLNNLQWHISIFLLLGLMAPFPKCAILRMFLFLVSPLALLSCFPAITLVPVYLYRALTNRDFYSRIFYSVCAVAGFSHALGVLAAPGNRQFIVSPSLMIETVVNGLGKVAIPTLLLGITGARHLAESVPYLLFVGSALALGFAWWALRGMRLQKFLIPLYFGTVSLALAALLPAAAEAAEQGNEAIFSLAPRYFTIASFSWIIILSSSLAAVLRLPFFQKPVWAGLAIFLLFAVFHGSSKIALKFHFAPSSWPETVRLIKDAENKYVSSGVPSHVLFPVFPDPWITALAIPNLAIKEGLDFRPTEPDIDNEAITQTRTELHPLLGEIFNHEQGWVYSKTYGWVYLSRVPWIHLGSFGWVQMQKGHNDSVRIRDTSLGWLSTSTDRFPALRSEQLAQVLHYREGSTQPRWFYRGKTETLAGGWFITP